MDIIQTNRFKKAYKKLHSNQLPEVNEALGKVIENPAIGEQKKGSLSWLHVYKFKVLGQLALLGYNVEKTDRVILTFVDIWWLVWRLDKRIDKARKKTRKGEIRR